MAILTFHQVHACCSLRFQHALPDTAVPISSRWELHHKYVLKSWNVFYRCCLHYFWWSWLHGLSSHLKRNSVWIWTRNTAGAMPFAVTLPFDYWKRVIQERGCDLCKRILCLIDSDVQNSTYVGRNRKLDLVSCGQSQRKGWMGKRIVLMWVLWFRWLQQINIPWITHETL